MLVIAASDTTRRYCIWNPGSLHINNLQLQSLNIYEPQDTANHHQSYAAKEQGFRHLAFCKSPADNLHPGSWLGTLESTFHLSSCFPSHQDAQNTLLCKDGFYTQAENFIG